MTIDTERLFIRPLSTKDTQFILELLNTEGWLQYIGNRNINDETAALGYIQRIRENPQVTYWTVLCKASAAPTGLVTLIQRDYLDAPDIGFAFLPAFSGEGYAYEATKAVLVNLARHNVVERMYAITLPGNKASIKLLERLGLKFERIIEPDKEPLLLYSASKIDITSGRKQDYHN